MRLKMVVVNAIVLFLLLCCGASAFVSSLSAPARAILLPRRTPFRRALSGHGQLSRPQKRSNKGSSSTILFDMEDDSSESAPSDIVWTSLASTEKWITEFAKIGSQTGEFARKSISYECITDSSLEGVLFHVFHQLRSMREAGDKHGEEMKQSADPHTLRQTVVVVIPACTELEESCAMFNTLIEAINMARRDARSYITDVETQDENDPSWMTSVNLSHLHPQWGKDDKPVQDDDPATAAYRETRKKARQAPYPTLVIEVTSVPPYPLSQDENDERKKQREADPSVSSNDVSRLESLFGKAANPNRKDPGDEEEADDADIAEQNVNRFAKSVFSSTSFAHNWITEHDPLYNAETSTFHIGDLTHVDEAYEFLFSQIDASASVGDRPTSKRDYLVLPNFCSKSATSFEKFAVQATKLIGVVPHLKNVLSIQTFHSEQVDKSKRSPVPILALQWGDDPKVEEEESAFQ